MTACLGVWFTVRVFRDCLSICMCVFCTFGSEDGIWGSIV